ncbi:putative CD2 antigen cytoplasmic tail-binding protein 2/Lin1 [Plasmopara halstedii]
MVRRGITRFDMDEEKDEGHFDDDGNFVWDIESKKLQEEAWLENISEQQMSAAMNAKSRREYCGEQEEETMTEEEAVVTLATLLQPSETVLQALKRLGSKKSMRVRSGDKRKRVQRCENESAQTLEEKYQFEHVTEAADFLMRLGDVGVYSKTNEEFISEKKLWRREHLAQPREGKSEKEVMWEYKTSDGQIHGPFPSSSFLSWQQQGYFIGDNAVDMRKLESWEHVSDETKHKSSDAQKQETKKVSVGQEMLNDFDDCTDEVIRPTDENELQTIELLWIRSDTIDFKTY